MPFVVASVAGLGELAGGLKALSLDAGAHGSVAVVTNAHNVKEGALVVLATVGTELRDGTTVAKRSVGGVPSEGVLCDCPMLGWKGHAGSAAVIPADAGLAPGDDAPASKPLPGHAKEQAPADDRPAETLFARKPTKEEKKAAAEARKAKRAARKAAGDPDLGDDEANEDGM